MFSKNEIEIIENMQTWCYVIDWLEAQNKNVAGCLAFLFKRDVELYGAEMEDIIYRNKKFEKKYPKYADEVEKYLMLV